MAATAPPPVAAPAAHPHPVVAAPPSPPAVPVAPAAAAAADTSPSAAIASTAEHPSAPPPTATIDPSVPSSESAPTALPTNPHTHPAEQREAIANESPEVIKREVEKTKAAEREIKGERPLGTVVRGIEDDRLWAMLRRFDTQVTHVLHPAHKLPPTEPDLRPSPLPNLPSHSDVLKSNLERVIAAVGPSGLRGAREAGRLMDWSKQERWRTGSYCAAYFVCWIFGYTLLGVATDPTHKRGDESLLGAVDSKAVHRSKAEQAEEQAFEARSILQAYTTRLVFDGRKKGRNAGNSAVGEKDSASDSDDEGVTATLDGAVTIGQAGKDGAQGTQSADVVIGGEQIKMDEELSEKKKKKLAQQAAKRKRDELVGKMIKGTEQGLGDLADFIERLQNAVSPPSAYPDRLARFKLAGAFILPPALVLTFVPAWMFGRAATFFFGVGFWGQPLAKMGMEKFVELVPNWKDYLELLDMRNSLLSGVPTDAQLTLHVLRVAEALNSPIPRPPPPPLEGTPKEAIKDSSPADITADDDAELQEAIEDGDGRAASITKAKVKAKGHILGAVKGFGKKMAGFKGDVSVDGARKQIGSKVDRLLFAGNAKDLGENDSYPARLDGESGHIIVENRNDVLPAPQLTFVPLAGTKERFVWPVDDIVEIKKSHVSMGRIALGWASGADVEGLGLTIRFKPVAQQAEDMGKATGERDEGTTMHFTRVVRREQLFVRLISMGAQRWEML